MENENRSKAYFGSQVFESHAYMCSLAYVVLSQQNTTHQVICEQQTFIPYSSIGGEIQNDGLMLGFFVLDHSRAEGRGEEKVNEKKRYLSSSPYQEPIPGPLSQA